jgi:hypothetical protein
MGGRMGSNRIARLIVCLSAFLLASLWQSSAWAIDLPPPLEDVKEKIKEKIEEIKDKLPPPPDERDIQQQFEEFGSQIQQQVEGIGGSAEGDRRRSRDARSRSEGSDPRSQQADGRDGDLEDVVGGGQGIGGMATGGLSFFCTRGEALCFALPIAPPAVKQPKTGGGLEFTGLDLQRAIAVFFIFAGAGTILLAWDARSRAALID